MISSGSSPASASTSASSDTRPRKRSRVASGNSPGSTAGRPRPPRCDEDCSLTLRLVVSAVDTYETRRDIAGELPREILNAGTMPRDFTVSSHRLGDGYACLACLYRAAPRDAERDVVLSRELGFPASEVAELLRSRAGLSERQLQRIAEHRGLPSDRFLGYQGAPLDTFHHKEFCATAQVATSRGEAVAPLAFGSAWAGFLLAEGLAAAGPKRYFRVNTFAGLDRPLWDSKRPRTDCVLCARQANPARLQRALGARRQGRRRKPSNRRRRCGRCTALGVPPVAPVEDPVSRPTGAPAAANRHHRPRLTLAFCGVAR